MDTVLHQEEQNRKIGLTVSIVLHSALILLALLNLFTFPTPPPGQPSVAISFGAPDVGQGEEEPAPAQLADATDVQEPAEQPAEVEEPVEEVVEKEVKTKPKERPKKERPKKTKPKDNTKKITSESDARKIAAEKKKKAAAAAAAKKAQEEAAAAAAAKAAKKAKADAAAAAAAAAAKAKEDAKNKFKDVFNGGGGTSGSSQGTSGTPGNAGVEDGDPDATVLSGEGSGNGDVSGFGGRGYTPAGPVSGNFQEMGTVSLKVCVDANGKVTSAKQTLKGTTTPNQRLIKLAIKNAKKYKFSKSDIENQCGKIIYRFKLQ